MGRAWNWVFAIAHETTGETSIVSDRDGGGRGGEATFVKTKGLRAIVFLGEWVVEDDGVCLFVLSNGDAI